MPPSFFTSLHKLCLFLVLALWLECANGFHSASIGADGDVWVIRVQPDGKILLGGAFTQVNGFSRNRIARLNSDGSLDFTFDTAGDGVNNRIHDIEIQPDGKIVIGGSFSEVSGQSRNGIARLNANGRLDTTFNPGAGVNNPGIGFGQSLVLALALQTDGKIVMGGSFTSVNGSSRNRIARLNANGSVDSSFAVGSGANDFINEVLIQDDGKILISGGFTVLRGNARNYFARLSTDSSVDQSFSIGDGANDFVRAMAIQSNGKIVIGGEFSAVQGVARPGLATILPSGALDTTTAAPTSSPWKLALQANNKVLSAGFITGSVARFNADLSSDPLFQSGPIAGRLRAVAVQEDGKILIGGTFNSINGKQRNKIARLNTDGSLDLSDPSFCFVIKSQNQRVFPVCL